MRLLYSRWPITCFLFSAHFSVSLRLLWYVWLKSVLYFTSFFINFRCFYNFWRGDFSKTWFSNSTTMDAMLLFCSQVYSMDQYVIVGSILLWSMVPTLSAKNSGAGQQVLEYDSPSSRPRATIWCPKYPYWLRWLRTSSHQVRSLDYFLSYNRFVFFTTNCWWILHSLCIVVLTEHEFMTLYTNPAIY